MGQDCQGMHVEGNGFCLPVAHFSQSKLAVFWGGSVVVAVLYCEVSVCGYLVLTSSQSWYMYTWWFHFLGWNIVSESTQCIVREENYKFPSHKFASTVSTLLWSSRDLKPTAWPFSSWTGFSFSVCRLPWELEAYTNSVYQSLVSPPSARAQNEASEAHLQHLCLPSSLWCCMNHHSIQDATALSKPGWEWWTGGT